MSRFHQKDSIHNSHRNNIRKNALKAGIESLKDHNLLELLLFNSVPRRNTNDIAHKMLESCGGLEGLIGADEKTLKTFENAGESTALFLSVFSSVCEKYAQHSAICNIRFDTVTGARNYFYEKLKNETDAVIAIYTLDASHSLKTQKILKKSDVIHGELLSETVKDVTSTPCNFVFIAFTHPNGILAPDRDEINYLNEARKAFLSVGVLMTEVLIVTNHGCRFLSATDILPKNFFLGQHRP